MAHIHSLHIHTNKIYTYLSERNLVQFCGNGPTRKSENNIAKIIKIILLKHL